jgi:hypothetical protein
MQLHGFLLLIDAASSNSAYFYYFSTFAMFIRKLYLNSL